MSVVIIGGHDRMVCQYKCYGWLNNRISLLRLFAAGVFLLR